MLEREIIRPPGFPVPDRGYSPAVRYGRWVFVSGLMATDYASGLASEARGNIDVPLAGEDPLIRESRHVLELMKRVLTACGTDVTQAVRIDQFPTTRAMVDPYHVARQEAIPPPRPASTSVEVQGLLAPSASTAVELLATASDPGIPKEAITTDRIPQPLAGYAPAIRSGDWIFASGQVPTDFRTGLAPEARVDPQFWEGSEIDRQARYTLKNLALTLEAAGSSLANVVKANVYLTDIDDIPRLDRVWREFFPDEPPARTIVPVKSLVVPECRIEITLVAIRSDASIRKTSITTPHAPEPLFHQAQAIRAGEFVFLSGLLAADSGGLVRTARANPAYPYALNGPAAQMRAIMNSARAICRAADTDLRCAVRMLAMHSDLREFAYSRDACECEFPDGMPASTTIGVPGPLAVPGCTIAVDLWVGIGR